MIGTVRVKGIAMFSVAVNELCQPETIQSYLCDFVEHWSQRDLMGVEDSHLTLNCKLFQCVSHANTEFNQSVFIGKYVYHDLNITQT